MRRVAGLNPGYPTLAMVQAGNRWKLPAFAMCADDGNIDIPVPDFTFEVRGGAIRTGHTSRNPRLGGLCPCISPLCALPV